MSSTLKFPALAATLLSAAIFCLSACHSSSTPPATAQNPPAAAPQTAAPAGEGPTATQTIPAQSNPQPVAQAAPPPPPPPPEVIELREGTSIPVRLDDDLGSKISQPGQAFSATVADDVLVRGKVIIPKGARADGTVVDAQPLGRFKGGARLEVRLDRVHTRYGSYPVSTSSIDRVQQGKGKRSAEFIGGGAGLGALIGGLAGGGKGAAIGALAGGGAGTAGSAFSGNKQIVLPAETLLSFKLSHSVRITEQGRSNDPALRTR